MRFRKYIAVSAPVLLALVLAPFVWADVIPLDSQFGPGTLIWDTDTNLQWLSLKLTQGLSPNEVLAGLESGGTFDGFRLATMGEFLGLTWDFGISLYPMTDFYPADNYASFVELLGPTTAYGDPLHAVGIHVYVKMEDSIPFAMDVFEWEIACGLDDSTGHWHAWTDPNTTELQFSKPGLSMYGFALVQPIPEPSTLALLGIGLAGLIGYGWRQRKA